MKKLILVAGPAGIGKSRYCRTYAQTHPQENVQILSSDEIRKAMTHSYRLFPLDQNGAKDLTPVYEKMVEEAQVSMKGPKDVTVLLDTTMLQNDRRLYFLDRLTEFDDIELDLLKVHDYRLCLQRNKRRNPEKWVPEEVVEDMIKSYEEPSDEVRRRCKRVADVYVD
jgi:tRNA uridine 5-carbamoylmethylation protein Kti12